MARFFNFLIFSVLLSAFLISCDPPSQPPVSPAGSLTEAEDLGGVFDPAGWLYVKREHRDSVLNALGAERNDNDSIEEYRIVLADSVFYIKVKLVEQPAIYLPENYLGMDELAWPRLPFLKIWVNAECGKNNPGFQSQCIGAFGRWRQFGRSMEWNVNAYKSCRAGKSLCIEAWRPVGQVRVYLGPNCGQSDSSFRVFPIQRFRCD